MQTPVSLLAVQPLLAHSGVPTQGGNWLYFYPCPLFPAAETPLTLSLNPSGGGREAIRAAATQSTQSLLQPPFTRRGKATCCAWPT